MRPDFEQNDLPLKAFQFYLEELPLAETLEFEELLATSQPARDALADAVLLHAALISQVEVDPHPENFPSAGIAASEALPGVPQPINAGSLPGPKGVRRWSWTRFVHGRLAVMTCSIAVLGLLPVVALQVKQNIMGKESSAHIARTAKVWSSMRDLSAAPVLHEELEEREEGDPLSVPDWLLIAVTSHEGPNPDETSLQSGQEGTL